MLKYKLYKEDGNLILYHYYPQDGEAGVVSVNKDTGETKVMEPSADDFGNRFAFKLCKRLKEFFESKTYRDSGTIAWY